MLYDLNCNITPEVEKPRVHFSRGAQLVEALRYKPEGREFDSRWCHWKFLLT
jgi:hypothetical protein